MNTNELKNKANALHSENYNCAQSVACVFSDIVGIDEKTLFKISEGFGGGMGDHKECCGAITGGMMILSLLKSSGTSENLTKAETYEITSELRNQFLEKYNITLCESLKDYETKDGHNICDDYIADSVEMVCRIIEQESLLNNIK